MISTIFAEEQVELPQDRKTSLSLSSRNFNISLDSAICICLFLPFWMWWSCLQYITIYFLYVLYIRVYINKLYICLWRDDKLMPCLFRPLSSGLKGITFKHMKKLCNITWSFVMSWIFPICSFYIYFPSFSILQRLIFMDFIHLVFLTSVC